MQLVSAARGEGSMGAEYERPLFLLMGMAAMFFLVGCLNLGNLQLARLAARQREIGVRIALGASRARVLRQLLAEDLLLLAIGGVLALVTCRVASAVLLHWASGRERLIPLDLRMSSAFFLVGIALLIVAQVGFSVVPAWQITRRHPGLSLRSSAGNIGNQGRRGGRWATLLLTGQVSLSLLLLCMAALFARTLQNLGTLDTGLDRDHVLSVHLDLMSGGLDKQDLHDLNQRLLNRLKAPPFCARRSHTNVQGAELHLEHGPPRFRPPRTHRDAVARRRESRQRRLLSHHGHSSVARQSLRPAPTSRTRRKW